MPPLEPPLEPPLVPLVPLDAPPFLVMPAMRVKPKDNQF